MFKEVEKDPRCCSCDKGSANANLSDFPRFKEVEKNEDPLQTNRSISINPTQTPLDHIDLNVKL